MSAPSLVVDCRCECGENPVWDAVRDVLLWVDIPKGRLFEYSPGTGDTRILFEGDPIGGFTLQENGDLLLFESNRIALWNRTEGRRVLLEGIDSDMLRFNDVLADPVGRVFAGSIGSGERNGGLYRLDRDGSVECLFKDTRITNGMAVSPMGDRFYYTDSSARRIDCFDYERGHGVLSNRRLFAQVPESEGLPDGLTLDAEGGLWSARWDGACLVHYSPEGKVLERVALPVEQVTSACFGGHDLKTLFITTAGGPNASDPSCGGLYSFQPGVTGRLDDRSRIEGDCIARRFS